MPENAGGKSQKRDEGEIPDDKGPAFALVRLFPLKHRTLLIAA
jgi:hypothetical protein